jgi:hypothetical protein
LSFKGAILFDPDLPRFYSNLINLSTAPYDMTLTFIEVDGTRLQDSIDGPHETRMKAGCQVIMSLGHAKAMVPLLVKAIADYEQQFGEIPAPGFDQQSKE